MMLPMNNTTNPIKICIVRKLNDPFNLDINMFVDNIHQAAKDLGYIVIEESDLSPASPNQFILSVGGDGTMLHAMRLSEKYNAICTGFHAGNLGFLNDFDLADYTIHPIQIHTLMSRFDEQEWLTENIEYRYSLRVCGYHHNSSVVEREIPDLAHAFNEISISSISSDTILKYDMIINGDFAGHHRANSVLVSPPNGSTAYSLSAGGALIDPSAKVIQIVPVAPNTLTSRPIIVPMFSEYTLPVVIEIHLDNGFNKVVRIDGRQTFDIEPDNLSKSIVIEAAGYAQVLHNPFWSFYETLTAKLGWAR